MPALSAPQRDEAPARTRSDARPPLDAPDWLTLQQAACELGVSGSTVRRMIREGRLVNRMIAHRGGFAYLVFIPGSRHGAMKQREGKRRRLWPIRNSREQEAADRAARESGLNDDPQAAIASLERQVEQLSHALSRALRTRQKALPIGVGDPGTNTGDPYARYRWLARRPRWWPFS
jgi:excisionase family DNA binding protein